MSLFTFFSGSGNNAFKNQVKVINDNESLTDAEKVAAIDLLLNPIYDYGITFQGARVSYQGTTINYMGVN